MLPRDLPLAPRASLRDVLAGRAKLVGSRTDVGRNDLDLAPGVVSPYEAREAMGLKYGDPPIEEARYERARTPLRDAWTLTRWAITRLAPRGQEPEGRSRHDMVSARVDALDTTEAIGTILGWLRARQSGRVYFVHPHALNLAARDGALRAELEKAELVLPDGIGLRVAGAILGSPFPANVNGTDLVPELLLELAAERIPVVLIGGAEGVAEKAGSAWSARTGVRVAETLNGFADDDAYRALSERVAGMGPCVVLVAMGSPHQERFVGKYLAHLQGGVVGMTVGGLFDFASGDKPRAPLAWRELGMEWAWRLVHEPRRLARRYLLGNPEFLLRATAQRVSVTVGALSGVNPSDK